MTTLEQFLRHVPTPFVDLNGQRRIATFKYSKDLGVSFIRFTTPEGRLLSAPIVMRNEAQAWFEQTERDGALVETA